MKNSVKDRIDVDAKRKNFRVNKKFLGIKITGFWRYIPHHDYISVFNARIRSTFFSRAGERTMYTVEHQVNAVKGKEITTMYEADSEEQAKEIAETLAKELGEGRFLDATQKPPQWVEV